MATQYQIFCRYLNETVNRTLTNQTTSEWISATEFRTLKEFYKGRWANLKACLASLFNSKKEL